MAVALRIYWESEHSHEIKQHAILFSVAQAKHFHTFTGCSYSTSCVIYPAGGIEVALSTVVAQFSIYNEYIVSSFKTWFMHVCILAQP